MKVLLSMLVSIIITGYAVVPGMAITVKPAAQAIPTYKCKASSYHAFGIGWGPNRGYAARRALVECARHTPIGDRCYIDWCRRIK
jgi:hypothetical protein